ncbi:MAG: hypothetical protein QXS74_06405 [Nitrososphaeria archaeon]
MEIKHIKSVIYWYDPENNKIISPEEYIEMEPEKRNKLTIQLLQNITKVTFAYCPVCNKWERYHDSILVRYAKDCRQYSLLDSLSYIDPRLFDLIVNKKGNEQDVVKYLKRSRIRQYYKAIDSNKEHVRYYIDKLKNELEMYKQLYPNNKEIEELYNTIEEKIKKRLVKNAFKNL